MRYLYGSGDKRCPQRAIAIEFNILHFTITRASLMPVVLLTATSAPSDLPEATPAQSKLLLPESCAALQLESYFHCKCHNVESFSEV